MAEPLTPREREIALLAGEGLTNQEIGERLCITKDTVKNTIYAVYNKLPEMRRSRARLAVWLYRQEQEGDAA